MRVIHADAIITGDAAPIRDAAVVVDDRGAVDDVGPAAEVVPRASGLRVERVRGVLLPGLVNAHTHLELSGVRGQVRGGAGFVPWVQGLIGVRSEVQPEEEAHAIEKAVDEIDAFGTSAVGEVTNTLASVHALARRGLVGSIFHEVFGLDRAVLDTRVAGLEEARARIGAWPKGLAYSPAPHTLYTMAGDVARKLADDALARGQQTTLHLAEHAAERRVLENGDGPVAEWFESMLRVPRTSLQVPRKSPVAYAADLGMLAPHVLLVHLTDAKPEELDAIARSGAPVVLCPRSNLFIEVRLPPFLAMRAAGLAPALGTDSLASNTSLDVLAEARALADRFTGVPARELLQMATWNGARALGRTDLGRVAKGANPGLFAITGDPGDDPCAFVLRKVGAPRRWIVRRMEAA